MARRTGQIIRRGDARFVVRVYLGTDTGGKRRYHNHTIRGTKKDAQAWLTAALRRMDLGEPIDLSKELMDTHLDAWLKVKGQTVKARTLEIYDDLVTRIIRPVFGAQRINDIAAADIQRFYLSLSEQGYGGRTIELIHVTLTNIFKLAGKWDLLRKNPMLAVDKPRHTKQEMKSLSTEQARSFLKVIAGKPNECLFQFLILTGCRPGELLALQWADIDHQHKTVTIQRTLARLKTGWQFTEPKTAKSKRTIPIPVTLLQMLQKHKRNQQEQRLKVGSAWRRHELVFCNAIGDPLGENYIRDKFRECLTEAELPHFRVYDLRHSVATLLMGQGLSPKIVSERLGHANINITLGTYSHVLPTMQQEASDKLEKLLFG
jgi:integrase